MLLLARAGVIEVYISPPILKEIETVLVRKFRWAAPRVREVVGTIRRFAVLVNPGEPLNVVQEDEPDNRILECALAAEADTIVTGDQHLLKLKRFRGILIASPRQFLDVATRR